MPRCIDQYRIILAALLSVPLAALAPGAELRGPQSTHSLLRSAAPTALRAPLAWALSRTPTVALPGDWFPRVDAGPAQPAPFVAIAEPVSGTKLLAAIGFGPMGADALDQWSVTADHAQRGALIAARARPAYALPMTTDDVPAILRPTERPVVTAGSTGRGGGTLSTALATAGVVVMIVLGALVRR